LPHARNAADTGSQSRTSRPPEVATQALRTGGYFGLPISRPQHRFEAAVELVTTSSDSPVPQKHSARAATSAEIRQKRAGSAAAIGLEFPIHNGLRSQPPLFVFCPGRAEQPPRFCVQRYGLPQRPPRVCAFLCGPSGAAGASWKVFECVAAQPPPVWTFFPDQDTAEALCRFAFASPSRAATPSNIFQTHPGSASRINRAIFAGDTLVVRWSERKSCAICNPHVASPSTKTQLVPCCRSS